MPGQGRLGDQAQCAADAHGCPACPHPTLGPAVSGSPDVLVNGRPALRVGDTGVHAACCGPNLWTAQSGAPRVFINGRPAHRLGDATRHCGSSGRLVQASPDVLVGDSAPPSPAPSSRPTNTDHATGGGNGSGNGNGNGNGNGSGSGNANGSGNGNGSGSGSGNANGSGNGNGNGSGDRNSPAGARAIVLSPGGTPIVGPILPNDPDHHVVSPGYPDGPITAHVPPGMTYGNTSDHLCGTDWWVGSFALQPDGSLLPITTDPLIPPEVVGSYVWRNGALVAV